MELRLIELPAKLPEEFYELPWKIYSKGHQWIPPFICDQRPLLEENKLFEQRKGKAILCYKHGNLVGRLVVFTDATSRFKTTGFFGLFEVIDNIDVTRAMFDLAYDWLKKQGKTKIAGPINLNMFNGFCTITEGHDLPPYYQEPRNPIYYNEHFVALGMKETGHWDGWTLGLEQLKAMKNDLIHKNTSEIVIHQSKIDGIKELLHPIYKMILRKRVKANYFSKVSFEEFQQSQKRSFTFNDSNQFVAKIDQEIVGLCLTHFDISPALIMMNGDPHKVKHLEDFPPHTLVIYFFTVKECEKQKIIEDKLLLLLIDYCEKIGIDRVVMPITSDFNPLIVKFATKERKYALYTKTFFKDE